MPARLNVLVLGSGVIGLSTANEILKRFGKDRVTVNIWTEQRWLNTTSVLAGAAWTPGFGIKPLDKVREWSHTSLEYFRELARKHPESGVKIRVGYAFGLNPEERKNAPQELVEYEYAKFCGLQLITPENDEDKVLPGTKYDHAYRYECVGYDMVHYLQYLEKQFFKLGGASIVVKKVTHVEKDVFSSQNFDILINCTGLGSRELFGDKDMETARGQAILVQVPEHISEDTDAQKKVKFWFDETDLAHITYILPRNEGRYVLGGTFDRETKHTKVLSSIATSIMDRCDKMVPSLKLKQEAKILQHWVGLRPFRSSGVRVEKDTSYSKPVIHNYGHGGSGVTISYATAVEVTKFVEEYLRKSKL
jgi:glycine/D-amino acid oxidase-like deaminating enzyme